MTNEQTQWMSYPKTPKPQNPKTPCEWFRFKIKFTWVLISVRIQRQLSVRLQIRNIQIKIKFNSPSDETITSGTGYNGCKSSWNSAHYRWSKSLSLSVIWYCSCQIRDIIYTRQQILWFWLFQCSRTFRHWPLLLHVPVRDVWSVGRPVREL